jgi:23S rRNA pseudouridine1911/1915/1917 synthase
MASKPNLIYEDRDLLIIYKPAGMPSASLKEGEEGTLAAWILARFPEQSGIGPGETEGGLVHRLDNDTSGVVAAARTEKAYAKLREQFQQGMVRKEYLGLVVGHPPARGSIDAPIAHHPRKKKKMVVCESEARAKDWGGRPATTKFSVLQRYTLSQAEGSTPYALVEVSITTGVRHQIRVHLASLGYPIAGDRLYQTPKKRAADILKLERHFLHAHKLTLDHPSTGQPETFSAPLPHDLQKTLDWLEAKAAGSH